MARAEFWFWGMVAIYYAVTAGVYIYERIEEARELQALKRAALRWEQEHGNDT